MKGWFCPKHGYICAETEVTRIRDHRVVCGCKRILELREDLLIFKLPLEAPA